MRNLNLKQKNKRNFSWFFSCSDIGILEITEVINYYNNFQITIIKSTQCLMRNYTLQEAFFNVIFNIC